METTGRSFNIIARYKQVTKAQKTLYSDKDTPYDYHDDDDDVSEEKKKIFIEEKTPEQVEEEKRESDPRSIGRKKPDRM